MNMPIGLLLFVLVFLVGFYSFWEVLVFKPSYLPALAGAALHPPCACSAAPPLPTALTTSMLPHTLARAAPLCPQCVCSTVAHPAAAAPLPAARAPFVNAWRPTVPARRGESVDLSWLPAASVSAVPWYPSSPRMRFNGVTVEAHALLLQSRLLSVHAGRAGDAAFVLLDVGCNMGSFALFWVTLGFHAYCIDVELTGGPSGAGEFSWASLAAGAAADAALPSRLTLFHAGIAAEAGGWLAYAGDGHQYAVVDKLADARGVVVPTATAADLLGVLPGAFLAKIDIDGGEIGALRSLLASGRNISNIHVEVTPGYWGAFGVANDAAALVLAAAEARYDVHVVFWREASQVCCRDIFRGPPPEAWANAPLGFVQRLSHGAWVDYVMQMAHTPTSQPSIGQRDFWLSVKGQDIAHVGEIRPLRCPDVAHYADAFDDAAVCAKRHDG